MAFYTAHSRWLGLTLISFLAGTAIALLPIGGRAQACALGTLEAPSESIRRFRSDRWNISFSLPANYRAMLRRTGHITLHDPAAFEFLQCLARSGRYGQVPLHVTVELAPVSTDSTHTLEQLIRRKRPWVDYYNPTFTTTTLAEQPALAYDYTNEIYGVEIANVSFLQINENVLVTVTGPSRDPVFQTVLSTFELGRVDN
ncbi:MAG: hypothetical protein ACFB0C_17445 [Leptolyngbyaceae cyanobacterium]